MRFQLKLFRSCSSPAITLNYPYPLSAAIYRIIQTADADYSTFLHNAGYGKGLKRFKLFTFSELRTPFRIEGDRMVMLSHDASLQICFHLPVAAETFIRGLFLNRELEIADARSKVRFTIASVEAMADDLPAADARGFVHAVLQPLSPLVVGRKNERGHYDYLSPADADFGRWLVHNWVEKWATAYEADEATIAAVRDAVQVRTQLWSKGPQQRVIAIKQGTSEETKVKGFMKFGLEVEAPREMVELALGAGLGIYNAVGCGCVGAA